MIELIDNLIQFTVTIIGCIGASLYFYRNRRQPFYLLAFFYGVYSLATLYWTLFLTLLGETPPIFYVSDVGWIASYVFLLLLLYTMRSSEKKRRKTSLCWLLPIFCVPQFILYITHGDVLYNLIACGLTMFIGWFAIEGLVGSLHTPGKEKAVPFYTTALCFTVFEYCLWTSSCFWSGDTLANPYFWFDFLLSATMLLLMPTLKKAVIQ